MTKKVMPLGFAIIFVIFSVTSLIGQESNEDLARAAANPVAPMMNFPFQNNLEFGLGEYDRAQNILNIQPVIPLAGGKFITRTILPVVWVPDITAESGMLTTGLADTLFTIAYLPPTSGGLIWAPGVAVEIPTGGKNRGSQKWSLGPSIILLAQPGPWTLGLLANNVWSVGGNSDRDAVNKGLLQYFIVRQLGGGLYVNSAPAITVNWNAPEGQKWTIPFGAGIGKVFRLGKIPFNGQIGAYYNVVRPDLGPKWQFRVQIQFMLPTSIFGGNK